MSLTLLSPSGRAQFTFASDNASNYGGTWNNGSDQGTGFGSWGITAGSGSGPFTGNPSNNGMGTTGIGTTAFGIYATGSGYLNAGRGLDAGLGVGDTLSFYWAMNWDANGGNKGFDLKSGGTTVFNVNNGSSSTITAGGNTAFTAFGTSPMLVTLTRTSGSQYSFEMTARDGGSAYSTTINSSASIDNFNLYSGNQNDGNGNRNIYFNAFSVTNSGVFSATRTVSSALTGSGALVTSNGATVTLTSDGNTFTGGSTVQSGTTLNIGGGGGTGDLSGNVVNSGNVTFDRTGSLTYGGVVSGTGSLSKSGSGTVVLTGANSTSGGNTISAGTLQVGSGGTTGAIAGTVSNNGTLAYNRSDSITQSGAISGNGNVAQNGGATLTLDKANTYTGETQINAGTVALTGSLNSSSMIYVGSGVNSSGAALSLSGTTTLANNIQINVSSGAGAREFIKADATSQIVSGNITNNRNSTINVTNAGGNLDLSGVLTGGAGVTKTGSGTLVLSGGTANTLSGGLTVSGGEVIFGKSANVNAVGGSVTVASNATLKTSAVNQFGNNLATVDGTLDLAGNGQSLALAGSGTVSLGAATLTNNVGGTDVFSGKVTGVGGLVKAGSGTSVLSGANDYVGATMINAGVVEIRSASALGSTAGSTFVSSGAVLRLSNATSMTVAELLTLNGTGLGGTGALRNVAGDNTLSGNITLGANTRIDASSAGSLGIAGNISGNATTLFVGGGRNTSISGVLSGTGGTQDGTLTSLYKDGAGVLTLGGNNTYSGDTRVTAGTLTVASGGDLGNGTSDVFISGGATININANTEVASIRETGTGNGGVAAIGAGATLSVSGNAWSDYMNSIGGAGNLSKSGTGTMNLYGTQSYTGTTEVSGGRLSTGVALASTGITVSDGTFAATAANIVGNTTVVAVNGGTYSVGGSDTIGKLIGSGGAVDITNGTLTTSFDGSAESYAGSITGIGGFAKAGSGTLTLSGNSTKTGTNTVSGGTLVVDGQLGGVTAVGSGATLGGSGSVGATTIASGGTINPGNSPGTLSLTNGLTFSGGGNYDWQIYNASGTAGSTNGWDLLAVSGGAWNISGLASTNKFNINLWSLGSLSPDVDGNAINFNNGASYSWEILTYTSLSGDTNNLAGLFNINTAASNAAAGFSNPLNGGTFSLAVDGNSLNLLFTPGGAPGPSPVPEPGTWAAAALLAGAAGYVRWRRRKEVEPEA